MGHAVFPLEWPPGLRRREPWNRKASKFKAVAFTVAAKALADEVARMGGFDGVLSTNLARRIDGTPILNRNPPSDPGAALYFDRRIYRSGGKAEVKHYAIACDLYRTVGENVRALVHTVEAMRSIERHGSSELLEQAMSGFLALPPADEVAAWWRVLGFGERPTLEAAKVRWRELVHANHPDRGGDGVRLAAFNDAIRAAQDEASA